MSAPRLIETRDLDPEEIETHARKRDVSDAAVESLMASITELGMVKDEIIVRRVKRSGALRLVAGAHRLEACRRLGRPVPAKVFECTDGWAELMEIDDNIAGGELTILDTAVFLAHRKRIYEDLHPEAKSATGAELAAKRWNATDKLSVASFAASTAEKLGVSERKVYRLLAVGSTLDPKDVRLLRAAPQPVQMTDLQHIAKIGESAERYFVCEALGTGRAKRAAEARKAYRQGDVEPAPKDPVEEGFQALMKAWTRAPMAARRRFLDQMSEDIEQMGWDRDE